MRVISALELHLKDILQQTSGHARGACVRPGVAEPDCEPVHLHPHPLTRDSLRWSSSAHDVRRVPAYTQLRVHIRG